jgi:hypothetical protein
MKLRAELAIEIIERMHGRKLAQAKAAELMPSVPRPDTAQAPVGPHLATIPPDGRECIRVRSHPRCRIQC